LIGLAKGLAKEERLLFSAWNSSLKPEQYTLTSDADGALLVLLQSGEDLFCDDLVVIRQFVGQQEILLELTAVNENPRIGNQEEGSVRFDLLCKRCHIKSFRQVGQNLSRDLHFDELFESIDDESMSWTQRMSIVVQKVEHFVVVVLLHFFDEQVTDVGLLVLLAADQFPEVLVADCDLTELGARLDVHHGHAGRGLVVVELDVLIEGALAGVGEQLGLLGVEQEGVGFGVEVERAAEVQEGLLQHGPGFEVPRVLVVLALICVGTRLAEHLAALCVYFLPALDHFLECLEQLLLVGLVTGQLGPEALHAAGGLVEQSL
jgi:hypothetical protein